MWYNKAFGIGIVFLAGVGGFTLWKYYVDDDSADDAADNDYFAGLNFGISGWKPQLPIHPKSQPGTAEAVYAPAHVSHKTGPGTMVTARTQDYVNPAQLVPTTGPGNLAPIPGVNTSYVNADQIPGGNPFSYTEELSLVIVDTGSLTPGGPMAPFIATSYKQPVGSDSDHG